MRFWLAVRAFWKVLWNGQVAARVAAALRPEVSVPEQPKAVTAVPTVAKPQRSARSEAVTLLAALQREARFVDIVKEPLEQYSDAQIGAAARDVLQGCARVLDRMFGLQPLVNQPEGSELEAPAGYDAGCYRLTGNVLGDGPFRGRVVHAGWQASHCDLPQWSGTKEAARVVAPVELEVK